MKVRNTFEVILLILFLYSFYSLFSDHPKAPLILMISMSLLAFFYLILAFYKIFLGIIQKSSPLGLLSVFTFFALAFSVTGIFSAVFVNPVAKAVIIIGLVSSIGCMLYITARRNRFIGSPEWPEANALLLRLVVFTLFSFYILRTSSVNFYKTFGPLKKDETAIELLEECQKNKENCKAFSVYQNKKMSERWK